MTRRPQRHCSTTGCTNHTRSSAGYCVDHRPPYCPKITREQDGLNVGDRYYTAAEALDLAHRIADALANKETPA
ncbi:hypothetical protein [Gordonia sp. MP11Mi]|uniref:Uncharacterized protein n=1 Tax=Gordonia sp. MP11Mi TaxID=3022769 RepID=A0AA97CV56_9ACTN